MGAYYFQRWYQSRRKHQYVALDGDHDPLVSSEHGEKALSPMIAHGPLDGAEPQPEPDLSWRASLVVFFPAMLDVVGTTL